MRHFRCLLAATTLVLALICCLPIARAQTAVEQNDTSHVLTFLLVSSTDHITGLTGATPTVYLSKNGAVAVAATGTISEVDSTHSPGLYKLVPSTSDVGTMGDLHMYVSATNADPTDRSCTVVAYNPYDAAALGLSSVSTAATQATSAATSGTANATAIAALPSANATAIWAAGTRTVTGGTVATVTSPIVLPSSAPSWFGVAQSGDSYSRIGAPSGASIAADIAALPTSSTIATAVGSIVIDASSGNLTLKQALLLTQAVLTGKYSLGTFNTNTHTQVTTYYKADGATVLSTSTVTYASNNTTITGRTTTWTNLP